MTWQQAGSLVGQAVGAYFGGPIGGAIGGAIGSYVGASFDPPLQGPKLSDLKVQFAAYGVGVPRMWGTAGVAGNVIWSTDKIPHEREESTKGGPQVVKTSYTASFAILLCQGEKKGYRRVWAGSRKAFDITDVNDVQAQAASADFAQYVTFYSGSEDQLPDPTLESYFGVGNVPAFRGWCYVVFKDFPLDKDGNNIASFTFELTDEDAAAGELDNLQPYTIGPWDLNNGKPRHAQGRPTRYSVPLVADPSSEDTDWFHTSDYDQAVNTLFATWPDHTVYQGFYTSRQQLLSAFGEQAALDLDAGLGPRYAYIGFNTLQATNFVNTGLSETGLAACSSLAADGIMPDEGDATYMISATALGVSAFNGAGHAGLFKFVLHGTLVTAPGFAPHSNCTNYPDESAADAFGWFPPTYASPHRFIRVERLPGYQVQACGEGDPCELGIAQLPGLPTLCVTCDGTLAQNFQYTPTTGSFVQLQRTIASALEYDTLARGPILLPTDPRNTEAFWSAAAAAAGMASAIYGVDYPVTVTEAAIGSAPLAEVGASSVLLSTIVEDVCAEAGYWPEQVDASELDDVVPGYVRSGQMRARDALEPLRAVYAFDAVELDRQIVFRKRGRDVVDTIGADDLAAGEGEPAKVRVTPTRAQETELPQEVTLSYLSRERDYEAGTQQARRMATTSQQKVKVDAAVVMDDQAAAEAAAVILYDAWVGREAVEFATTRAFTALVPTDEVTVDDGQFTYRVRLAEKNEDGPVIRWKGTLTDPASYQPNAAAVVLPPAGGSISYAGPMKLALLDLPLLRDADDGSIGPYMVAAGYLSGYAGGVAYRSSDGGASFASVGALTVPATFGYTQTALPGFGGGNTVDEASTVDVLMHAGLPSSITRAQLLAGGNAAVIGDELVHFRRAELIGTRTVRLSGFLRGRKGTERHMAGHAAGELVVLLDAGGLYHHTDGRTHMDVAETWKGVAYGSTLAGSYSVEFTNTGAALMPLAPVQLRCARVAGDALLSWQPRTRYDATWHDEVVAPLGEASEAYAVRLYADDGFDTVMASYPSSAPTLTCTAAQLAADFGTPPATLHWGVCQLSATVGAGYEALSDGTVRGELAPAPAPAAAPAPAPAPAYPAYAADLATVASVTFPAPSLPATEYLTGAASYGGGTDGSTEWGGHQNRLVREDGGALFAVFFTATATVLCRSADGGAYGSAWTVVDTIAKSTQATGDLDAHLLRNPLTNQVHLVLSDAAASSYRIRTYSAAGALVDSTAVNCGTARPWLDYTGGTCYSSASIGADGTIALTMNVSVGTFDGVAATQMDSVQRLQTMKWNGSGWAFNALQSVRVGPRPCYVRLWVSPPGAPGKVVLVGGMDVKFNEWSAARNPHYVPGWTNTAANATYFGGGRYAEILLLKASLADYSTMTVASVLVPAYRTTDLSSATPNPAEYKGYNLHDCEIDSLGRLWLATIEGDGATTQKRCVTVVDVATGAQIARAVAAGGITTGALVGFHERDSDGSMVVGHVDSGNSMSLRVLTCTVAGSTLTVQTPGTAVQQSASAWGRNLTTNRYQCIPSPCAVMPRRRSGSLLSKNWFDLLVYTGADHTGTAPGTAQTLPGANSLNVKRVRAQLP